MNEEKKEEKLEEERDLWVAEFSMKQRAFHIEPLRAALAANMSAIIEGAVSGESKFPEFIIFGMFVTREQADQAVEKLRALLIEGGMSFQS